MSGKEKRLNTDGTENTEGHRGRKKSKGRTDVRNAANHKQHTAHVDDCRGTGNWVPGGHGAGRVSNAEVFSEHARAAEGGIQNERAAHGESFGVHGGVDAGRDSAIARAGKGTGTAASHRKRARGTNGASKRRSDTEHAGGAGGG